MGGFLQATCSNAGARVLSVDAAVQSNQRVTRIEHVALDGGGGTDMRVRFEEVNRLRPRPTVLVVVTDGQTPWPTRPATRPVRAVRSDSYVRQP